MPRSYVVIPARYGSTRLPRKMLLRETGKTLLLSHLYAYTPIPDSFLRTILAEVVRLPTGLEAVSGNRGVYVVSMSVLAPGERLVFWDVVWPKLKYAL